MIITVMSQMKYKKLSGNELEELVRGMNGWELKEGKLQKSFRFTDFIEAFGFMTRIALEAEKLIITQSGQMCIMLSQLN